MAVGNHSTVAATSSITASTTFSSRRRAAFFFLDYLAMGKLEPDVVEQLVEGMSRSCRKKPGWRLIGGETAEMPGFYFLPVEYRSRRLHRWRRRTQKTLTGKSVLPGDR